MPYKDKVLQREAVRRAVQKHRGITETSQGITVDTKKAAKLLLLCKSLDKEVTGLDGKRVNLLTMVRYGISGPTLSEIKRSLLD